MLIASIVTRGTTFSRFLLPGTWSISIIIVTQMCIVRLPFNCGAFHLRRHQSRTLASVYIKLINSSSREWLDATLSVCVLNSCTPCFDFFDFECWFIFYIINKYRMLLNYLTFPDVSQVTFIRILFDLFFIVAVYIWWFIKEFAILLIEFLAIKHWQTSALRLLHIKFF